MKPLFPNKLRQNYQKQTGIDFPKERRSGRSTAIALKTIADAIENPGRDIFVTDHLKTRYSKHHLLDTIINIIRQLKLEAFCYSKLDLTIRFCLVDEDCPVQDMEEYNDQMIEEFDG